MTRQEGFLPAYSFFSERGSRNMEISGTNININLYCGKYFKGDKQGDEKVNNQRGAGTTLYRIVRKGFPRR